MVNLKNFLKVGELRFIIINIFSFCFIIACNKIVSKSQLLFKDCKIYANKEIFTGKYEFYRGDNYVLSYVVKGELKNEKTYKNDILLMEKIYYDCNNGYQKDYDLVGNKISEGSFVLNKRVGEWKYFTNDSIYFVKY